MNLLLAGGQLSTFEAEDAIWERIYKMKTVVGLYQARRPPAADPADRCTFYNTLWIIDDYLDEIEQCASLALGFQFGQEVGSYLGELRAVVSPALKSEDDEPQTPDEANFTETINSIEGYLQKLMQSSSNNIGTSFC